MVESVKNFETKAVLNNFYSELKANFATKNKSLSGKQKEAVAMMKHSISGLGTTLKAIAAAQDALDANKIITEFSRFERQQELDKRIAAVSQELLIASCASTISMDKVMQFAKDSKVEELNSDSNPLNDFNDKGFNPLAAALAGGRNEKDLGILIDAGADVNAQSEQGNNAAHFAVMFDVNKKSLNLLITKGVDFNATNNAGLTPLDMALQTGKTSPLTDILNNNGAQVAFLAGSTLAKGALAKAKGLPEKGQSKEDESKKSKKEQSKIAIPVKSRTLKGDASLTLSSGTDPVKDMAIKYLEESGIKCEPNDDRATLLQKALLKSVQSNQPMMTLSLIDSGALVNKEIACAAIDTKNMNLITTVVAHSTSEVIVSVDAYSENYAPAAALIDGAMNSLLSVHSLHPLDTVDANNLGANGRIMGAEPTEVTAGVGTLAAYEAGQQKKEEEMKKQLAEESDREEARKAVEIIANEKEEEKEEEEKEREKEEEEERREEAKSDEAGAENNTVLGGMIQAAGNLFTLAEELSGVVSKLGSSIKTENTTSSNNEEVVTSSNIQDLAKGIVGGFGEGDSTEVDNSKLPNIENTQQDAGRSAGSGRRQPN